MRKLLRLLPSLACLALVAAAVPQTVRAQAPAPGQARDCQLRPGASVRGCVVQTPDGPRTFDVVTPARIDPRAPIIFDDHGFGGVGAIQTRGSGIANLVERRGFVFVAPDGIQRSFNGQTCCGQALAMNVNERAFVEAMLQRITRELNIQPAGVFNTGISNGMAIGNRFACEASDVFDVVAGVSFQMSPRGGGGVEALKAQCKPTAAISYMEVHASADTTVPFNGSPVATLAAPVGARTFAEIRGCNVNAPTERRFNSNTTCTIFSGCQGGGQVQMCTTTPGNHSIYGTIGNGMEPNFDELAERFFLEDLARGRRVPAASLPPQLRLGAAPMTQQGVLDGLRRIERLGAPGAD